MPSPQQISNAAIRMGEMDVAIGEGKLRTLLGSCVGLALYDRRQRIGGLAHIVLPAARGTPQRPGKYVDTAVPLLISQMREVAGADLRLWAKIAGGASMFTTNKTANIGRQNIEACENALKELTIPIIARHCGGEQGRRMSLDIADGSVAIEIVGQGSIEL